MNVLVRHEAASGKPAHKLIWAKHFPQGFQLVNYPLRTADGGEFVGDMLIAQIPGAVGDDPGTVTPEDA